MDEQRPTDKATAAQPSGAQRVAIATPDGESAVSDDPETRNDLLVAALRSRGVSAEGASWTDPDVNWDKYDLVLLQNVWEYHLQPQRFRDWLRKLQAQRLQTWNPMETILWNLNKTYLADLQRHGVDIVDTVFVKSRNLSGDAIFDIMRKKGWTEAVVKPCIGADSLQVAKVHMLDPDANPETSCCHVDFAALIDLAEDAMVQEYLPNIRSEGECSLVYFDGSLSHMVWKIPLEGNFQLGKIFTHALEKNIPPDMMESGKKVMTALEEMGFQFLYARVDLVRDLRGIPSLMELELIEPSLFLDADQRAPQLFAEAVVRKLKDNGN